MPLEAIVLVNSVRKEYSELTGKFEIILHANQMSFSDNHNLTDA